jgi:N-methylhydantoinase B
VSEANDGAVEVIDPIELEILRTRLEAVVEQAAAAVEHTAISPTVTEAKDYSVTLLDASGGLVVGTGQVLFHFHAASHAVRSTIARHGPTLAPGDVFLANDPHNGGGLHPQDVMVQRPIFLDGELLAWAVLSAHMMDVGGMVVGSFAPAATECYQEGLRVPPVRLFRADVEQTDVFDIFRNNVRMAPLVEMDLRGLVAGCYFADQRIGTVVAEVGRDRFVGSLAAIRGLTEEQVRSRVRAIEDGVYRTTTWTEFDDEMFVVPCTLTVDGESLLFDYTGASPQTSHFFNSKPYIIASELGVMLGARLAGDLPFNEGVFACFELRCPEGTIVDARPPAPIAAAHMHVSLNAADVAIQAFNLALAASPDAWGRERLTGAGTESALGNHVWSWTTPEGATDAYIVLDGNWVGGSASIARDGLDLGRNLVGSRLTGAVPDVEILESWYPVLITERSVVDGPDGAGEHRGGGGNHLRLRPHGVDRLDGTMFGMRRWLPLPGVAGGRPGSCNEFLVHRSDGSVEQIAANTSGVELGVADSFELRLPSGGGYGDPLDRDTRAVARDVADGRFTDAAARAIYGVVLDGELDRELAVDGPATEALRDAMRADRLARARPATRLPARDRLPAGYAGTELPLFPGVVQRGDVAVAAVSGAPLAVAPDHFTDGCPVLEEPVRPDGPPIVTRTYLDPGSGRALHVEVVLAGRPRAFEVSPRRRNPQRSLAGDGQ